MHRLPFIPAASAGAGGWRFLQVKSAFRIPRNSSNNGMRFELIPFDVSRKFGVTK